MLPQRDRGRGSLTRQRFTIRDNSGGTPVFRSVIARGVSSPLKGRSPVSIS